MGGVAPMFMSAYWRAALAIRNTGRTAAVGVRVVITDVYRVTDSGEIATVGFSQRTLPGDGELSSRLVARFLLLSRAKIANHDSGFVFGPLSHAIFFFSSRRRHTRFDCDWSSDVCSSDLAGATTSAPRHRQFGADSRHHSAWDRPPARQPSELERGPSYRAERRDNHRKRKIGRASCRERV